MFLFTAPPPSYDSLFGRVREAQKSSKGILDFLKNVIIIVLGTCKLESIFCLFIYFFIVYVVLVGCTIILGVTIVIPICMIVMGSIYLHDCPQGEYIPVYLLVGGKFPFIKYKYSLSMLFNCFDTLKFNLYINIFTINQCKQVQVISLAYIL